jgi:nucleoside-diphosphate-sugar epimerase
MRILIIGGTRFIGPHVVQMLATAGHQVTLFHRGHTPGPTESEILGEKEQLHDFRSEFQRVAPEVVLHMIAFTRQDALEFVRTFSGISRRVVVISSIDVYRAFGRLHGTEPGPPDRIPLTENSPLRERPSIHGEKSEKRVVEEVVMGQAELPNSVTKVVTTIPSQMMHFPKP